MVTGRVLNKNKTVSFIHLGGLRKVGSGRVWSKNMEPHSYLSPVSRIASTLAWFMYSQWQTLVRLLPWLRSKYLSLHVSLVLVFSGLWFDSTLSRPLIPLYLPVLYSLGLGSVLKSLATFPVIQMVPELGFSLWIFILMLCMVPVPCTLSVQHVTNWKENYTSKGKSWGKR